MNDVENLITLGKVGSVYGIKGWLKIHSFTENPADIFDYSPWSLKLGGKVQSVTVTDWRKHNNGLIAKFASVEDRDIAQSFVSSEILIEQSILPDLPEGEFYWRDLIGMSVVTEQGYSLGEVTDLMETGANDVLVVTANRNDGFGKKERLVPYLFEQVIKTVDAKNKQITVDWDPGF